MTRLAYCGSETKGPARCGAKLFVDLEGNVVTVALALCQSQSPWPLSCSALSHLSAGGAGSACFERAAALRVPAMYQFPEMVEEGGLIGYGPRLVQIYRDLISGRWAQREIRG